MVLQKEPCPLPEQAENLDAAERQREMGAAVGQGVAVAPLFNNSYQVLDAGYRARMDGHLPEELK